MRNLVVFSLLVVLTLTITNCASIIHGSTQKVDFTSQPSGAKITINGQYYGNTPKTLVLRRKGYSKTDAKGVKEYNVMIEMDGFYPYNVKVKRQLDAWFFGNIIFGGLIGIGIDAASGSMYKLTPDQLVAQMGKNTASINKSDDNIYIAVTLTPDPGWEKIDQLAKR